MGEHLAVYEHLTTYVPETLSDGRSVGIENQSVSELVETLLSLLRRLAQPCGIRLLLLEHRQGHILELKHDSSGDHEVLAQSIYSPTSHLLSISLLVKGKVVIAISFALLGVVNSLAPANERLDGCRDDRSNP